MTQDDVVRHWQQGARDAMDTARWNYETGKYDLALFNCHLAVEKSLKAAYIKKYDTDHPYTHELLRIASELEQEWDEETREFFSHLSDYAIAARYSDPTWAREQATKENALLWVSRTESFLSSFLPQL